MYALTQSVFHRLVVPLHNGLV